MSLLAKVTVTPLLYACGALLSLSIGLGITVYVKDAQAETAEANLKTANAEKSTLATQLAAWKEKAEGCVLANQAWSEVADTLKAELKREQEERARISAAGNAAVASARAEARDAERTLQRMAAQFQAQSREPPCAQALARVAQSCPRFEGY